MSKMLAGAVRNGWITDQHGSWAMGFVPLGYGLWLAKPLGLPHLLMVGAWTCGFFFFAVAERWLKFRFKKRYRPALYTYGGTAAIFSAILVVLEPQLWWWALVYVPLIAISFFQSWARRERELSSRLVAIAAATLVLAVVVNINSAQPWFGGGVTTHAWVLSALFAAYFSSTVPFVKTLIRQRNSPGWLVGSIATHVVLVIVMIVLAARHVVGWAHVVVWVLLLIRAISLPLIAKKRAKPWRPRQVGLTEIGFSILVFVTLPVS